MAEFLGEVISLSGLELTVEPGVPKSASNENISFRFEGPDTPTVVARNGDLLFALEHVAAVRLRLPSSRRHTLYFDAGDFRATRQSRIDALARAAVVLVHKSGKAYEFPAMNAYERQLLHLALQPSGLPSESTGAGARRRVVLYPTRAQASAQEVASMLREYATRTSA